MPKLVYKENTEYFLGNKIVYEWDNKPFNGDFVLFSLPLPKSSLEKLKVPSKTEFDAENKENRIDVLIKKGSYLYWKREKGYNLYLYSLGDFYVQLWLSRATDKIVKLESFSSDDALLPFVDDLELPI